MQRSLLIVGNCLCAPPCTSGNSTAQDKFVVFHFIFFGMIPAGMIAFAFRLPLSTGGTKTRPDPDNKQRVLHLTALSSYYTANPIENKLSS